MIPLRSRAVRFAVLAIVLAGTTPLSVRAAQAGSAGPSPAPASPSPSPEPGTALRSKAARPAPIVTGRIRYYDFTRYYRTGSTDQSATALGLKLHVETAPHDGLGFGATYYSANPIADGDIIPAELESSLPGTKVNTLAEAYAQYSSEQTLIRAGRQTLVTPWANPADSREIPVTFYGIGGTQTLSAEWSLSAYRILSAKNRTAATFSDTSFVSTEPTSGFSVIGLTRKASRNTLTLWDYHFNGLSDLQYADFTQTIAKGRVWHSGAAAQFAAENNVSDGALGSLSGHLYGAKAIAGIRNLEFALAYDRVPVVTGAYKNGAFVSPYTYGDNADPLYTTLIGASLVEKASPGQAYALSSTITSPDQRLKVILARGRFDLLTSPTVPKNELYETDTDLAYDFLPIRGKDATKGVWLHERWFAQDTTVKPYSYSQSRFFVDYVW